MNADASRRGALLALLAAALPLPASAQADSFPTRPIKLVAGFTPGGATDITARLLANQMGRILGQPVVVENKPGASGNIGAEFVARAPADGYTIMYTTSTVHGINPNLFARLPYDPVKDFAPIMRVGKTTMVLIANNDFPAKTVGELIAQARARPGRVAYASAGPGSTFHLTTALFAHRAQVELLHVPYKGSGPALSNLMSGDVQVMFDNISSSQSLIRAGKVRPIAVAATARSAVLPEVPTIAESGLPGFGIYSWGGLVAPAHTPREVIRRLNEAANKALQTEEVRQAMRDNASEPQGGTPEEFAAFIRSEMAFWGDAVKLTGAKAD
ncbi:MULTISPECIES: Bug family tripartite tricarboxylate transporter substrate binding protein [unclassified Variovorax]|jgi:tripartite-type tricarboxylate transporter receptor subunit TctC|uniref:Bug family tripartite tricarboxylate transporter substrate binding protein n=1 Tax=Variovorax TaxID=34072 RepID=UPI0007D93EDE|nr:MULTISPECIES: tripartite tricarboxylate transporter substrate binding protein [unclassified Variovorax]MBS74932.1 tripartite tricarboxylate transporter substrate binding protein [Variovorax sp.]MCT8177965.1 tripartite tricarboxylate transporter substrate binding protein [Variovorax sp. CY25R-8]